MTHENDAVVEAILTSESMPSDLADELRRARAETVGVGCSGSDVVRFVGADRTLYVKRGADLGAEAERLQWLAGRWGAPTVEHSSQSNDGSADDVVVMTEVAGLPSHLAVAGDPNAVVAGYGAHLAALHQLPAAECPFSARPDELHAAARERADSLDVGEEGFGGAYSHLSPTELFEQLAAMRPTPPAETDLVVVHGDYSMPNVIFQGAVVTGTVDVGRLGVGDRYCDLGVAARSLIRNLGPEALPVFFDGYGLARPEMLRLEYHVVLDEFS